MERHSRVSAALLLCVLLVSACGEQGALPGNLVPENLSRFDANVVELVERQMNEIRSRPNDAAAYAELGYIYEANEVWPVARVAYDEAVRRLPESTWWRHHQAIAARESGDLESALSIFLGLAAAQPELAPVQQRLGEALSEMGDLDGAAAAYRRVIELAPRSPEGYLGLGKVQLLERNHAAARQSLERAVALDPRYRAARYALGLAYRGLGLLEAAERELSRGLDAQVRYLPDPLTPQIQRYAVNLPALRNRAASLLLSGRPEETARILEEVLEQQPGNPTDLNNLAIAYMRVGRMDEARQKLETARDLAPGKFSTWLNLSSLATRSGDPAGAADYAREAVRRAPNMPQAHVALAMAEAEIGGIEQAAAALEEAARLDGRDPQVHGMLAEVSVELGRLDVAEAEFKAVLGLLPDSLTAILGLGRLYLQQGRTDEAEAMLARANQLAPGNARVAAFESDVRESEKGGRE